MRVSNGISSQNETGDSREIKCKNQANKNSLIAKMPISKLISYIKGMQMSVKSCCRHYTHSADTRFVVVFVAFNRKSTNDIGFMYRCTFMCNYDIWTYSIRFAFLVQPKSSGCAIFFHWNFIQHWNQLENVIRNRGILCHFSIIFPMCTARMNMASFVNRLSQPANAKMATPTWGKNEYDDDDDDECEAERKDEREEQSSNVRNLIVNLYFLCHAKIEMPNEILFRFARK